MEQFDKWNDGTGVVAVNSGYYSEMEAVIVEAVHIGIQMALYEKIEYKKDGSVKLKR